MLPTDRSLIHRNIITRSRVPKIFEDKVIPDDLNLSYYDQLSRNCILIARSEGFFAAWDYVIEQGGVNHSYTTGTPYVGKTTATASLANRISKEYDVVFDERNCVGGKGLNLSPELIRTQFPHVDNFENIIIFIDEIQHPFPRMRSTQKENVEAIRFFNTIRKLGINTMSTCPDKGDVDTRIVNSKMLWWLHCYEKDIQNRTVSLIIKLNARPIDPEAKRKWITVCRMVVPWAPTRLYNAITEKISEKQIYSSNGLKEFDDNQRELENEAEEKRKKQIIQKIMGKKIGSQRKAYRLLDYDISDSMIRSLCGLSYGKFMDIKAQKYNGVKEREIEI